MKMLFVLIVALSCLSFRPSTEKTMNSTRSGFYIFVEDFINILMKLVEINVYQEIINVGSGYLHSVNEILENVKAIQSSFEWEYTDKKEFDNVTFELSTKKLRGYLKNFKFTPLDKGIKKTFDWMENSQ